MFLVVCLSFEAERVDVRRAAGELCVFCARTAVSEPNITAVKAMNAAVMNLLAKDLRIVLIISFCACAFMVMELALFS